MIDTSDIPEADEEWFRKARLVQGGLSVEKIVDVTAEVQGETEKAWRLSDGKRTEWVPKSQVENNGDGTFTMPEWLAREKGFI